MNLSTLSASQYPYRSRFRYRGTVIDITSYSELAEYRLYSSLEYCEQQSVCTKRLHWIDSSTDLPEEFVGQKMVNSWCSNRYDYRVYEYDTGVVFQGNYNFVRPLLSFLKSWL